MAERGLLLRDFEVRNFLANGRGQIRRPVSPQPPDWWNRPIPYTLYKGREITGVHVDGTSFTIRYPFGDIGQVFWMRETWGRVRLGPRDPSKELKGVTSIYRPMGLLTMEHGDLDDRIAWRADGEFFLPDGSRFRWRSSTNMPHWAARPERLKLTGRRVEWLQKITLDDCLAEGLGHQRVSEFRNNIKLWNSLHPKYPWSANPLVWVAELEVLKGGDSRWQSVAYYYATSRSAISW